MTIGTGTAAPSNPGAGVYACSYPGVWRTLHADLSNANESTVNLLSPTLITDTNSKWTPLAAGMSKICRLRALAPVGATAIGTSPIVGVYLGWGTLTAGVPDSGFRVERLDATTWGGAGQTLSFNASPSTSNNAYDATYWYSESLYQTPTDLCGATHILIATKTRGVMTVTPAGLMPCEALFVN